MAKRIGAAGSVGSALLLGLVGACGGQEGSGTAGVATGATAGAFSSANGGRAAIATAGNAGAAMGGSGNGGGAPALPVGSSGGMATTPPSRAGSSSNGGATLTLPVGNSGGNLTTPPVRAGSSSYGGSVTTPSMPPVSSGGSRTTPTIINNLLVTQNPSGGPSKLDLLFMIDNSLGMGEKQLILQVAVPHLLRRLTNPNCVDPKGVLPPVTMADPTAPCGNELVREAQPLQDIHIGIITSSLGDFGGDICPLPEDDPAGPTNSPHNTAQNDRAWLLGALPRNASTLSNQFLTWSPADSENFAASWDSKTAEFRNFVAAASELGCGFEMSLEAWYRFLIDPTPPTDVSPPLDGEGRQTSGADVRGPLDQNILNQRKAFLRPDSLVAIFMLTDENDCSFRDNTYSWVPMTYGNGFRMWRGSSICKEDPNNECCYACMFDRDVPQKCRDMDTTCRMSEAAAKLPAGEDDLNVRCRQVKRRFGYDYLFPPSRYVNALTKTKLCPNQTYGDLDCECTEARKKNIPCDPLTAVNNPLFVNLNPSEVPTGPVRNGPGQVFLAGVVGVPWKDLAKDANATVLEYQKATQLKWDLFAPPVDQDYSTALLGDPLMIESFEPRPGLPGPDSPRWANPINGHEWNTSGRDVQSACIFSLETELIPGKSAVRVCDLQKECGSDDGSVEYKKCNRRFAGCACTPTPLGTREQSPFEPSITHSPLCQDSQGSFGSTQFFARAQPGLRELQVLRGFYEATQSDNAIVGSICPKDLAAGNQSSPGWGYNPAVGALVDQLQRYLFRACLPQAVQIRADGTVPCSVVEAVPRSADPKWCECTTNQRSVLSPELDATIRTAMAGDNQCGKAGLPACADFCLCGLNQLTDATSDGHRCLNEPAAEKTTATPGFCYVDPAHGSGSAQVVSSCAASAKQLIRIVGNANSTNAQMAAPAPGKVYLACSPTAVSAP